MTTTVEPSPNAPRLTVEFVQVEVSEDGGTVQNVSLRITADTRVPDADSGESDPGEPYFIVSINGVDVTETEVVANTSSFRTTIRVDREVLTQFESGPLVVNVTLMDRDLVADDEVAAWTGMLEYDPPVERPLETEPTPTVSASPTPSAGTGPTATEAATASPTPSPTAAPTSSPPSPTSTASPTRSTTRTPTASPTPTRTATPTPTPTPTPSRSERTEFRVTVVEVVDGDTIEVRFPNGDEENVRLLGVDSPEVDSETDPTEWEGIPDNQAGREHLSEWGNSASEFARSELETGEEIRIVVDEDADRRGSYGRLLVYLYDDGDLFNLKLLEGGYARLYDTEFSKRSSFATAEANAQDDEVGVWDFESSTPTSTPAPTSTPGQSEGELTIVEIHADAEGNDHENENDEYVVFENAGDSSLDLSGWRVEDEKDHTYAFPEGFVLEPGARVTLRTGSGEDSEDELYWGSGSAIWNNGGDTIYVYDGDGGLVLEESYS